MLIIGVMLTHNTEPDISICTEKVTFLNVVYNFFNSSLPHLIIFWYDVSIKPSLTHSYWVSVFFSALTIAYRYSESVGGSRCVVNFRKFLKKYLTPISRVCYNMVK